MGPEDFKPKTEILRDNPFAENSIVRVRVDSPEEFDAVIGVAYFSALSALPEDTKSLIRQAAKVLQSASFRVVEAPPIYEGEVAMVSIVCDDPTVSKESLLAHPLIHSLNQDFQETYGTDIAWFLLTETIRVPAEELELVT